MNTMKHKTITLIAAFLLGFMAFAQNNDKPNVLFIMVDDVAQNALSVYSHGMQYPTPNIDRIGNEGALFTDHYSQPSCTAGRAAFITGQKPVRTGLTTVGQPGNPIGIQFEDPTLADLLKPMGYMTAQFGKNHLGDRNEHLPTVHGFDEFYGNLYHLNVSEEPEQADYPDDPAFLKQYGPRGVIESYASNTMDNTVDPRFGKIGMQRVTDTGPLTIERMKVFDQNLVKKTKDFMKRAKDANKPFFIWHATSRQHVYIHQKDEFKNLATDVSSDMDKFGHGLIEHDMHVGQILDYLDELGMAENTIVIYTTDNGPEQSTFPDAGVTEFRGEKMTTWEGGVRAPFLVRWPAKIKAGLKRNGISAHEDVLPTIMAAVGKPNVNEELKKGMKAGEKTYKVHIDGYNNLDYWTGKADKSARNAFMYYYETSLAAIRVGPWKMHFSGKPSGIYYKNMVQYTMPKLYNLRKDPFEKYDDTYMFDLFMQKSWMMQPAIGLLKEHLMTFKDFPPRQEAASLNINKAIDQIMKSGSRQ